MHWRSSSVSIRPSANGAKLLPPWCMGQEPVLVNVTNSATTFSAISFFGSLAKTSFAPRYVRASKRETLRPRFLEMLMRYSMSRFFMSVHLEKFFGFFQKFFGTLLWHLRVQHQLSQFHQQGQVVECWIALSADGLPVVAALHAHRDQVVEACELCFLGFVRGCRRPLAFLSAVKVAYVPRKFEFGKFFFLAHLSHLFPA